ncbi:MAG: hypothetical protein M1401_16775 [Chloroflexi bacterium]|nr:hypothetical protein [Chloroflexota bacterium]
MSVDLLCEVLLKRQRRRFDRGDARKIEAGVTSLSLSISRALSCETTATSLPTASQATTISSRGQDG